ncbi:MAG: DUF4252 domain-containing protein [Bacteroidales bacterium]|jgi:hypothetical protein|nr:DUF4252 domain-containing protein [Bacteroidales bacterium]MCI2121372.1 DUF4252 domain-containing protein [Bacteroidales bacterium]MCI2145509.1 DUF4252 domain-containing protein [Bacteroidales bacterium]
MKSLKYMVAATLLAIATLNAGAQNQLYNKYSSTEGITKIYISSAMFKLLESSTSNQTTVEVGDKGNDLDVSKLAGKLSGLYILNTDKPEISKRLSADFMDMIKGKKLEILMEVEDEGEIVKMYSEHTDGHITDFYLYSYENDGECTVMHMQGSLTEGDLNEIMKSVK